MLLAKTGQVRNREKKSHFDHIEIMKIHDKK